MLPPEDPPIWPREEMQLACYSEGGSYAPHVDSESLKPQGMSNPGNEATVERIYTAIYYATEPASTAVWDDPPTSGGALRLWPAGVDGRSSYEAVVRARAHTDALTSRACTRSWSAHTRSCTRHCACAGTGTIPRQAS